MNDILFRTDTHIFSYRTAGILVHDGKVLLQKPNDSEDFAFPGGHVAFGETNAETLVREFKEEVRESDANAIYFYWIPLDEVKNINVYPANAAELLLCLNDGVKHFVYREGE